MAWTLNTLTNFSWFPLAIPRKYDSVTGWTTVESLLDFREKQIIFSTLKASRPGLGSIRPPIQCIMEAVTAGTKQSGREHKHSPTSRAVLKNTWKYISAHTCIHGMYGSNIPSETKSKSFLSFVFQLIFH